MVAGKWIYIYLKILNILYNFNNYYITKMLLRTYSKEEVNDLIQKEVGEIKNELIQYIGKLEQKNRILEETIEQIKKEEKTNNILVGYFTDPYKIPVIIPSNYIPDNIMYHIYYNYRHNGSFKFILETLEVLYKYNNNIFFDINCASGRNFIHENDKEFDIHKHNYTWNNIKIIKQYCEKYGIKMKWNGSDYYISESENINELVSDYIDKL